MFFLHNWAVNTNPFSYDSGGMDSTCHLTLGGRGGVGGVADGAVLQGITEGFHPLSSGVDVNATGLAWAEVRQRLFDVVVVLKFRPIWPLEGWATDLSKEVRRGKS